MYAILIPAFQPDETLYELTDQLSQTLTSSGSEIIIVDDGSESNDSKSVISSIETLGCVTVLTHERNQGKGAALKTGLRYAQDSMQGIDFVVTADADGQHTPEDIIRVASEAERSGVPVLGVRDFGEDVPFRSMIGNQVSKFLFRLFSGTSVADTQTGLRAYHSSDFGGLLEISHNRYEFEFQALFMLVNKWRSQLKQTPIETIYEPGNPSSHFNPLVDSAKIYMVLLRHMSVSATTAIIDVLIFSLLTIFSVGTLNALLISRVIVTPYYFFGMRNFVFRRKGNVALQAIGTLGLIAFNVSFLWVTIDWIHEVSNLPRALAMVIATVLFYGVNFVIQNNLVFGKSDR